MPSWNSQQYLKFAKERTQPSLDLASRIRHLTPHTVLDIGCGPGNSTAVLEQTFPGARILGVDSSPAMIDSARSAHPALEFEVFDATSSFDALPGPFDLVFSNACIQWVPDNEGVIRRMMGALAHGGTLAVQVPINANTTPHLCIRRVVESDRWRAHFPHPRIFYTLEPEAYFDLLARLTDDFTLWKTTYVHRMASVDTIIEWYRGTGLRPYLDRLEDDEIPAFEADVRDEMARHFFPRENGEIAMEFPRLFFMATRP